MSEQSIVEFGVDQTVVEGATKYKSRLELCWTRSMKSKIKNEQHGGSPQNTQNLKSRKPRGKEKE